MKVEWCEIGEVNERTMNLSPFYVTLLQSTVRSYYPRFSLEHDSYDDRKACPSDSH